MPISFKKLLQNPHPRYSSTYFGHTMLASDFHALSGKAKKKRRARLCANLFYIIRHLFIIFAILICVSLLKFQMKQKPEFMPRAVICQGSYL
jgi:hypothetical protein